MESSQSQTYVGFCGDTPFQFVLETRYKEPKTEKIVEDFVVFGFFVFGLVGFGHWVGAD